ncbi:MAG: ABC-type transport auxiliary lipoprotein family protein [Pseudomonadota bacterium]
MKTPSAFIPEKTVSALRCGGAALLLALLAACSGLPDKPTRALMYDFGPGPLVTQPSTRQAPLPPLAIDDISTYGGAIENMSILYRLAYADEQQLRPYSQARWSMPPAQLIRQRMREKLSQRRAVFNAGEGAALNRSQNAVLPLLLKVELQEFSQLFTAPETSVGLVRLRATLIDVTPAGEKLLAQRNVIVQRAAPSSDAPGGARALTAATDAAIEEIDQWLQQTPGR